MRPITASSNWRLFSEHVGGAERRATCDSVGELSRYFCSIRGVHVVTIKAGAILLVSEVLRVHITAAGGLLVDFYFPRQLTTTDTS